MMPLKKVLDTLNKKYACMQENKKQITDNFNPIKQEEDGKRARRVIWTTDALNKALAGLNDGRKLVANPFYENNYKLLKGDLVFRRTDEEIEEWKHCANDIIYFANKYAKLMTPEGIQHVKLRDYQERYLKHLVDHRLSIFLSCRQSGKCVLFTTEVSIKIDWSKLEIDGNLKRYIHNNYYDIENDCYVLPLFEIYNFYVHSFKWKVKYQLYKMLYKLLEKRKRGQKSND